MRPGSVVQPSVVCTCSDSCSRRGSVCYTLHTCMHAYIHLSIFVSYFVEKREIRDTIPHGVVLYRFVRNYTNYLLTTPFFPDQFSQYFPFRFIFTPFYLFFASYSYSYGDYINVNHPYLSLSASEKQKEKHNSEKITQRKKKKHIYQSSQILAIQGTFITTIWTITHPPPPIKLLCLQGPPPENPLEVPQARLRILSKMGGGV